MKNMGKAVSGLIVLSLTLIATGCSPSLQSPDTSTGSVDSNNTSIKDAPPGMENATEDNISPPSDMDNEGSGTVDRQRPPLSGSGTRSRGPRGNPPTNSSSQSSDTKSTSQARNTDTVTRAS